MCYVYDRSIIGADEQKSLLKIVEEVIMQYGVKVVLLDNLMTAVDISVGEFGDIYSKQSKFVGELHEIALTHDALIVLVAHKRKNNFSSNENDEVGGSAHVTALTDVILSYGKDSDIQPDQRLLKVTKNRLFGKTYEKGWVTDFEERSKRIYGQHDDVNMEYGWCKDDFRQIGINEENPFG
jgi:predicted ATP-dependent serine protease